MSCIACKLSQQLGTAFYVRVGDGNVVLSGCKDHIMQLLDKLDKADKMEVENERN